MGIFQNDTNIVPIVYTAGVSDEEYTKKIWGLGSTSYENLVKYYDDIAREILTEGDTFADAIEMARDAIGLTGISMEDNKEELPMPSEQSAAIEKVKCDIGDIDFSEYRRKVDT